MTFDNYIEYSQGVAKVAVGVAVDELKVAQEDCANL